MLVPRLWRSMGMALGQRVKRSSTYMEPLEEGNRYEVYVYFVKTSVLRLRATLCS